jgi:hypothetical protein
LIGSDAFAGLADDLREVRFDIDETLVSIFSP